MDEELNTNFNLLLNYDTQFICWHSELKWSELLWRWNKPLGPFQKRGYYQNSNVLVLNQTEFELCIYIGQGETALQGIFKPSIVNVTFLFQ